MEIVSTCIHAVLHISKYVCVYVYFCIAGNTVRFKAHTQSKSYYKYSVNCCLLKSIINRIRFHCIHRCVLKMVFWLELVTYNNTYWLQHVYCSFPDMYIYTMYVYPSFRQKPWAIHTYIRRCKCISDKPPTWIIFILSWRFLQVINKKVRA